MDIFAQLRRDEGLRLWPYVDTVGKITIGYGRNLSDNGISKDEAEGMFQSDVQKAQAVLYARLPWFQALDAARQGVLLNMAFNMGFNKLEEFQNLLIAAAQGDWNEAAKQMMDSLWAKQVGDRAIRLAHQMLDGQWT